jgi:hemin uptake protein HemP
MGEQRPAEAPATTDAGRAIPAAVPVPPRTVQSQELLGHGAELWILHEGQIYRLRRTRNSKLILSK